MAITASLVKELREITGSGMMDCKKALTETNGDLEKAIEFLREKGLSAAAKKAGRIAAEGLTQVYVDEENGVSVIVEVNSETDFVAKNQEFQAFVSSVALQASKSSANDMDEFLAEKWIEDEAFTVKEALSQKVAVIGENLNIRRFKKLEKSQNGVFVSYIHAGGKVSVVVELISEKINDEVLEAGRNICMQIAAMSPQFIDRSEISEEFIEKEKEILKQQALNEGKAADIVEKMIIGRLNKNLKEMCLLDQEYVKDGDLTVAKYLENVSKEVGAKVTVGKFVRFETGEGIEKKEDDFAAEVNKAMGLN